MNNNNMSSSVRNSVYAYNLLSAICGTLFLLITAYEVSPLGLLMLWWFFLAPLIAIACIASIIYSLFWSYPKRKYVLGIYALDVVLVLLYLQRPTIYETYEKEQVQVQELVDYSLQVINDSCYAYLVLDTFHPYRNKEISKVKRDEIALDDQEYAQLKELLQNTSFTGITIDAKHKLVYLDFSSYLFGEIQLVLRRSYSDDSAWNRYSSTEAYNDSVSTHLSGSAL